jgi:hypothetical protein
MIMCIDCQVVDTNGCLAESISVYSLVRIPFSTIPCDVRTCHDSSTPRARITNKGFPACSQLSSNSFVNPTFCIIMVFTLTNGGDGGRGGRRLILLTSLVRTKSSSTQRMKSAHDTTASGVFKQYTDQNLSNTTECQVTYPIHAGILC